MTGNKNVIAKNIKMYRKKKSITQDKLSKKLILETTSNVFLKKEALTKKKFIGIYKKQIGFYK